MSMTDFFYHQLFTTIPYPKADHTSQTIIVTGANVGLGKEAARHLVRLNAEKVILAVRNIQKGEEAKASIEETTQRKGVIEVWQLDLSSYESTKQFAKRCEGLKRLDAVIENAGIATDTYRVTEDNESTITTNVVSTFLLALLLLPKLRESGSKYNITPRLSIVSSEVHFWTPFTERNSPSIFKTLNSKDTANMADRYQVSKLLEVLYARPLATHITQSSKSPVTINYLTPGLCHSELAREAGWGLYIMKILFARTTEHGSRSLVQGIESGPESHGQYLANGQISNPSPLVMSEDGAKAQARVWDELNEKLEKIQPGLLANI